MTSVWPTDDEGEAAIIILNNAAYSHVYFTFNDITFVKDSKIFVNGAPVTSFDISNGMQSFLFEPSNLVGDKKGILNNVIVTWDNTDGTQGNRTFVFKVVDFRPSSNVPKPLDPNDPYVRYIEGYVLEKVKLQEKYILDFENSDLCLGDFQRETNMKAEEDELNIIGLELLKKVNESGPNRWQEFQRRIEEIRQRTLKINNRFLKDSLGRKCN